MNQPNTYLDNQLKDKLKALRTYESQTYAKVIENASSKW